LDTWVSARIFTGAFSWAFSAGRSISPAAVTAAFGDQLPGHKIGMVLHARDQNHIAGL
jgi:hypothetical protein